MSKWMFEMLPLGAFEQRPGGGMRLHGGKGSNAPPPDPALIAAQIKSMGIQDDAIQRIMKTADDLAPLQKQQMQQGIAATERAMQESLADRTYSLERRGQLTGFQDKAIDRANEFDSGIKGEEYAAQGVADVGMQAEAARQAQTRQQQRMGVNPSSGKALALQSQMGMAEALGKASASNIGRTQARNEGIALEDRASNMLAGYPAMGMQTTGAGAQYGSAGLGIANSGLAGMTAGANSMASVAGAMGSNATSMYGAQASYKNQQDQIAASSDPFNTILGAAAGVGTSWALGKVK